MGMGPKERKEQSSSPILGRISYVFRQSATAFFEKPTFYLFYFLFSATMIGLFFGMDFPPLYLILLFCIWISEVSIEFDLFNLKKRIKNIKDAER
jgi:hypothetical protein